MAAIKIYAITKEHERQLFVASLTDAEFEALGDFGVDMMVSEWCAKKGYTYVDFGTQ